MANPYQGRAPHTFWRQGVAEPPWDQVDPVTDMPFTIGRADRVATAGSCFAQHLSETLRADGFNYLITEQFAGHAGTANENYSIFPARFGNVYTTKQLVQLFDRAYGLLRSDARCFTRRDGGLADPFRPRIQTAGYPSRELLEADRSRHFAAVREMFERCDVFIFTLGLTEYWAAQSDGAVYPLPPGVYSDEPAAEECRFGNFTVGEMVLHLTEFFGKLREVNRSVRIMLTVSPVPLVATYEDRHVLVSTIASKSALRAAADEICRKDPTVAYFPAYEIVAGPQAGGRLYSEDLREVSPAGVNLVMSFFRKHFLETPGAEETAALAPASDAPDVVRAPPPPLRKAGLDAFPGLTAEHERRYRALSRIVCDEETLVRPPAGSSPS